MPVPDRPTVRRLYGEGIEAVSSVSRAISSWDSPACGHWTATETARHLLAVANWYHSWLNRAIEGDSSPPFPNDQLDKRNEIELDSLSHLTGRQATVEFETQARSYLQRLTDDIWDLPFGYPFGTATAGLHAGAAATEWHLHAWDLAQADGLNHTPKNPGDLLRAVGWCRLAGDHGLNKAVRGFVVDTASRVRPWQNLIRISGR